MLNLDGPVHLQSAGVVSERDGRLLFDLLEPAVARLAEPALIEIRSSVSE